MKSKNKTDKKDTMENEKIVNALLNVLQPFPKSSVYSNVKLIRVFEKPDIGFFIQTDTEKYIILNKDFQLDNGKSREISLDNPWFSKIEVNDDFYFLYGFGLVIKLDY